MEVGKHPRKGNLYQVFSYVIFLIFTISSNAIAESCPDITALGAIANNSSAAVTNTNKINAGLLANKCVSIPEGVFWVSVSAGGILVSSGNTIKGINSESSVLIARESVNGAIIKRNTSVGYVNGVRIQDVGVILNQGVYSTQNPEMIGIDFSQITGSYISNVYVGTILPAEAVTLDVVTILTPPSNPINVKDVYLPKKDHAQGIGIRLCTISGQPYGGERNIVEKARVWGARIGVSIDDTRCLNSAAHGTIVRDSDIQTVEYGIAQQSPYTAGVVLSGNHIQDLVAGGNNGATMLAAYVIYGYTGSIQGGYIEAKSANLMKVLYLGDNAHGIKADLGYVSMGKDGGTDSTGAAITNFTPLGQLIRMAGYRNQVSGYDQFVSGNWLNLSN